MKCKLSEKCEFGNLCKDATKHDSLTVLGCSSFKTKKPITNEEWMRTATTEQLAKWLNDKIIICAVCDQQKICGYFINETCHLCPYHEGKNKSWEVWLKQPHREEKHE